MHTLAKLFSSASRLKLLRLFFFNENTAYTTQDIAFRTKTTTSNVRKEITVLIHARVIRRQGSGREVKYRLNKQYQYVDALAAFVRNTTVVESRDILPLLRRTGTLRLVVLTGLFSGAIEPKIDLLVVGDKLDERILSTVIHTIESDLGREIRYASFATTDFRYRSGVYDRLLRDVFDYSHRIILDKIGMS
ncbi:MAG TPA: hypothetical protein ENI56_01140 [Candidatus Kaiserbacteria bacterium]|nr:hypothetical protein [Candidatus Kaiserbacteria bacterium]